jgi:predicted RNA binding protein with dsRBD fold (UPF0201 family)
LSKDTLIQEFERELRVKDETYVKSLKKQAEDIDTLIDNMNKQTAEMARVYAEELEEELFSPIDIRQPTNRIKHLQMNNSRLNHLAPM